MFHSANNVRKVNVFLFMFNTTQPSLHDTMLTRAQYKRHMTGTGEVDKDLQLVEQSALAARFHADCAHKDLCAARHKLAQLRNELSTYDQEHQSSVPLCKRSLREQSSCKYGTCSYTGNKRGLGQHYRRNPSHKPNYTCVYCERSYPTKQELSVHQVWCLDEF